jgi:hypothetical protein
LTCSEGHDILWPTASPPEGWNPWGFGVDPPVLLKAIKEGRSQTLLLGAASAPQIAENLRKEGWEVMIVVEEVIPLPVQTSHPITSFHTSEELDLDLFEDHFEVHAHGPVPLSRAERYRNLRGAEVDGRGETADLIFRCGDGTEVRVNLGRQEALLARALVRTFMAEELVEDGPDG